MARRQPPRPAGHHWSHKDPIVREDGKKACRLCEGPVPPPKRNWCSQDCVDEWLRRVGGQATCRALCEARDRGVCASCGLDTLEVRFELYAAREGFLVQALTTLGLALPEHRSLPPIEAVKEARRRFREELIPQFMEKYGFTFKDLDSDRVLWNADHRVELADGGEWYDPFGLMTLCLPCHRKKSAAGVRRRAEERRALKAAKAKP